MSTGRKNKHMRVFSLCPSQFVGVVCPISYRKVQHIFSYICVFCYFPSFLSFLSFFQLISIAKYVVWWACVCCVCRIRRDKYGTPFSTLLISRYYVESCLCSAFYFRWEAVGVHDITPLVSPSASSPPSARRDSSILHIFQLLWRQNDDTETLLCHAGSSLRQCNDMPWYCGVQKEKRAVDKTGKKTADSVAKIPAWLHWVGGITDAFYDKDSTFISAFLFLNDGPQNRRYVNLVSKNTFCILGSWEYSSRSDLIFAEVIFWIR